MINIYTQCAFGHGCTETASNPGVPADLFGEFCPAHATTAEREFARLNVAALTCSHPEFRVDSDGVYRCTACGEEW